MHVSLLEGHCTLLKLVVDMVSLAQALSTTEVGWDILCGLIFPVPTPFLTFRRSPSCSIARGIIEDDNAAAISSLAAEVACKVRVKVDVWKESS